MTEKVRLSFTEISHQLRAVALPEVDSVVGITTGGIVPASMLAHQLQKPLSLLHINYRSEDNSPQFQQPVLLKTAPSWRSQQRVLIVDDVSVTGKTLALAQELLCDHEVTTLVVKGEADIVLFPEVSTCVHWPWS